MEIKHFACISCCVINISRVENKDWHGPQDYDISDIYSITSHRQHLKLFEAIHVQRCM